MKMNCLHGAHVRIGAQLDHVERLTRDVWWSSGSLTRDVLWSSGSSAARRAGRGRYDGRRIVGGVGRRLGVRRWRADLQALEHSGKL